MVNSMAWTPTRTSQLKNSTTASAKNNKDLEQFTPPHSLEAEQSVLGALLLDNALWDSVAEAVIAQDFYTYAHRIIFQEIEALLSYGKPADLITLEQALNSKNLGDSVGGFSYLVELSQKTPNSANALAYANIIREKAILRELIAASNTISENCYSTNGQDVKDILDTAESKILQISEQRMVGTESGPQNVNKILKDTVNKIELLAQNPNGGVTGISTGFTDLDKKTAGLQPGDLIIVAARPSMGKTTFAMNLCENAALPADQDKAVLIFSLEMPAEQLMMRMLSSLARVDQTKLRTGQIEFDGAEGDALASCIGMLKQKQNIYIDDTSGLTPTELRSRARRIHRESPNGLALIMVDYLQLMRVPGYAENRTLEIAEISRSLKALAKELKVPVIALSQLNRSLEQRADKRPVNSDLRESGAIEQDADLIMFIYRDEVYNPNSEFKGTAEIIIGKQRNGPIGSVRLAFQGNFSKFTNLQYDSGYEDHY